MRLVQWGVIALCAFSAHAEEADLHCPLYPAEQRLADQARLLRQRDFQRFSASAAARSVHPAASIPASNNFIDDFVFGKIATDGVPVADRTTDLEFLRRISIDLTGLIPTPAQIASFTADSNPDKRNALIDSLMASTAFVDRWTQWYGDQFKVGSNYYNFIQITGRNLFYRYVRDMLER